jgi:hypothetical protein
MRRIVRLQILEPAIFEKAWGGQALELPATLDSCYTLKQLLDVWPEVKPFVKDMLNVRPSDVVALSLPIKELNLQLGLKPQESPVT